MIEKLRKLQMNHSKQRRHNQSSGSSVTAEKKEPARKSLFGNLNLNQDLKQALNSWDSLGEEVQHKLSPAEEQLQEVKKLLNELKTKLHEFE